MIKSIYSMFFYLIYFLVTAAISIYSYSLLDPNLTLINHPYWEIFRNTMVNFGYNMRSQSAMTYLVLLMLLWAFHFFILKKFKKINVMRLSMIIGVICLFSYPFLSHDLFNYIFDAKILTFYGKNPYTNFPGFFYDDPWIRFMHWTDRYYPYGPVFLAITIIPSFFAFGIFIFNFIFFKIIFVASYIFSVFLLKKIDNKIAVIFATHPLVIIEGLINVHNDLLTVFLGIFGVYFLFRDKTLLGRVFLTLSVGIKYLSIFTVFITKKNSKFNLISLIGTILLVSYLYVFISKQSWYFLTLFIYLPWYKNFINNLWIFFFGLLLSYYPFIRYGNWSEENPINRSTIIMMFFILNLIYIAVKSRREIWRLV